MTKETKFFHLPIGFVVDAEKHLLFLKRIDRGNREPVKGGMEQGERPEDTIMRELYEETGLSRDSIKKIFFAGDRESTEDRGDFLLEKHYYIFRLELHDEQPVISINHDESGGVDHDDWGWFSLGELPDLYIEFRDFIEGELEIYFDS